MEAKQVLVIAATMLAAMGAPAFAQQAREPYVRVAEIEIDPAHLEAYTAAVKEQIEAAIGLEAGVLALYSVADKDNPAHVFVFRNVRGYRCLQGASRDRSFQEIQGRHPGHGEIPQVAGNDTYPSGQQVQVSSVSLVRPCAVTSHCQSRRAREQAESAGGSRLISGIWK